MMPELEMEMFDIAMPLAQPEVDMPQPELPEELLPGLDAMLDQQLAEAEAPLPMEADMMAAPVPEEVPGLEGKCLDWTFTAEYMRSCLPPSSLGDHPAHSGWCSFSLHNRLSLCHT